MEKAKRNEEIQLHIAYGLYSTAPHERQAKDLKEGKKKDRLRAYPKAYILFQRMDQLDNSARITSSCINGLHNLCLCL